MRLTLVQPPSGLYDCGDLAPPLGLLTIAATLEQDGCDVCLVDMNLRGLRDHAWVEGDFYTNSLLAIVETNPDIVGFTSMALESHVCLEMARLLKSYDSGVYTVMGGPHFSSIAQEVLNLYPWIDFVVTGEGELATRNLVRYLCGRASEKDLINVARRSKTGVRLERVTRSLNSLDALPFPAYEKVDLPAYFQTNPMRLLDYEHGRGCIFSCSFCYSPVHWGQGSQVKQTRRVVDEVNSLYRMGARHVFFVQDNFPNSRQNAHEICSALAAANPGVTWNCYATLPHLTAEFLDDLAAAGCTSVFIGVDAVSATSKIAFAKSFFKDWERLAVQLQACLARGIVPTCAFMVDPPLKDHTNTDAVLSIALFARAVGCGIRLNTLTLYNKTATESEMKGQPRIYSNLKPRLLLDTPTVIHDNPFARKHPELFPFHNTILPPQLYERFVTGMHFAYTLFTSFPRTLVQYVIVDGGSLWLLLEKLMANLCELTRIPATLRRPMERELFLREFVRQPLSSETKSAFELELAEYHLSENIPAKPIRVQVGDRILQYRTGRFGIVNLSHHPSTYDAAARLEKPQQEPMPYLISRRQGRIEYFELESNVVHVLKQIETVQGSEGHLQTSPDLLSELLSAGVLQESQHLKEGSHVKENS